MASSKKNVSAIKNALVSLGILPLKPKELSEELAGRLPMVLIQLLEQP
jgi:hypothetical protein